MIPISDAPGPRRTFPVVTVLLILANVLVFLFEVSLSDRALTRLFLSAAVVPAEVVAGHDLRPPAPIFGSVYATLVTSMFLHAGLLHVGSNMLYLWVFGDNVEDALGHLRYLVFYLVCGLLAGAAHIASDPSSQTPSLGASGAIAGVLGAYVVLYPHALVRTVLFLGPFITFPRVSAYLMIGLWFVLQLFTGVASIGGGDTGGVAVWAHVGGFAAGFILVRLFRPRPVYRS